jgi:hypothetical protein
VWEDEGAETSHEGIEHTFLEKVAAGQVEVFGVFGFGRGWLKIQVALARQVEGVALGAADTLVCQSESLAAERAEKMAELVEL